MMFYHVRPRNPESSNCYQYLEMLFVLIELRRLYYKPTTAQAGGRTTGGPSTNN